MSQSSAAMDMRSASRSCLHHGLKNSRQKRRDISTSPSTTVLHSTITPSIQRQHEASNIFTRSVITERQSVLRAVTCKTPALTLPLLGPFLLIPSTWQASRPSMRVRSLRQLQSPMTLSRRVKLMLAGRRRQDDDSQLARRPHHQTPRVK